MNRRKKQYWLFCCIVALVLVMDQCLKIWVKTHMALGDDIAVLGDWLSLHFVENIGIAFGMSFGGSWGKYLLTVFRLLAVGAFGFLLVKRINKGASWVFVVSMALIIVGALGNLVDSFFYGMFFSASTPEAAAVMFPDGGGYSRFMLGKVVDMFSVHLFDIHWPQWVPIVGGTTYQFFDAIFNIADSAVTVGVTILIIHEFFAKKPDINTNTKNVGETAPEEEQKEQNEAAGGVAEAAAKQG
ncbi:MAG: lipoprotein signal peptidase [Bacteroidales bacterium]|nr:lipoprotein signal peptidase [Bacteroidales bacterium]